MSFIKSRKHAVKTPALAALAASLSAPLFAHAQTTQQPEALPTVKATADRDVPYKSDASSNSKYTAPLLDTPQSIQVIPEQVLREQNATNLTEALRNSAGVSTFFLGENGTTSTGDAVYMRGYDASGSIFVDGIRDVGSVSRDVFNIGSVEVIKGPAGSDVGRSSPTGYINLITKKPSLENEFNGSLSLGSASFKRASVDVNRALDAESGTALRLNIVAQDNGVPGRDEVKNKRWAVAPSLAFGLGTDTRIFLDALHVKQDNIPDGGVPTIGLPGYTAPDATNPRAYVTSAPRVNSSNFYGTSSDFDNNKTDMLTARVEHDLKNGFKFVNTARYGRTAQNYMLTSWTATTANLLTPNPTDLSTWTIARSSPNNKDQINTILADQLSFSGKVKTGSVTHSLNIGAEVNHEQQQSWSYYGVNARIFPGTATTGTMPAANLYHPDPNVTGYQRVRNGAMADGSTTTVSAFAFDTLEFNKQWLLAVGLRADHYSTDYNATALTITGTGNAATAALTPTSLTLADTLVTGKLGLVYKPTDYSSVYVDYATGAQPPGGSNFALAAGGTGSSAGRVDFDPQKTKTYEIGTKWDLLDKTLSLTAAVYRTDVLNQVVQDPTSLLYYQTGKQRVQGLELGVVGQITKAWGVSFGYTTMDTKIISGPAITKDGTNVLTYTPNNSLTAWTTYDAGHGMTFGFGALHNGALHRGTDGAVGTPAMTDGYTVFNAMASYKINRNITVQLNLNNLFDKDYVASINKSGYRYNPGAPRSGQVTASFSY